MFIETVILNPFIPIKPTLKQTEFLKCMDREILFGGAAGGGKSAALLAGALQFVSVPQYSALILRRSFSDLALPGGLISMSHEWLAGTAASWNERDHRWLFPSGATVSFGYISDKQDKHRYQSSSYQSVSYDEASHFDEADYLYLFSRLRRLSDSQVPIRMRCASNPGGRGHSWLQQRFMIEGEANGRRYIPSKIKDNPFIDEKEYVLSLSNLDSITRRQLLDGDWSARTSSGFFKREHFRQEDTAPTQMQSAVRGWDLAASQGKGDWTVGCLMGRDASGQFWILDVRRMQGSPQQVQELILRTAADDGRSVHIVVEEEPGSSGKFLAAHLGNLLAGYVFTAQRSTGEKAARAAPLSSRVEGSGVSILRRPWLSQFLDEMESFGPDASHDDVVDAASLAFSYLCRCQPATPFRVVVPAEPDRPQQAVKLMGNVSRDALQKALNFGGSGGRPDWRGRNQPYDDRKRKRPGR
jgi:predicted phage terminase large subunit-like protein